MKSLPQTLRAWAQDHLLRRVARNSSYLFISNVISAVLSIVTANLLGVESFGVLALVMGFVTNINRLFSFRMGDLVVRYLGEYTTRNEYARAGALVKAAGLAEAVTSLVAFLGMVLLAPIGAQFFVKDVSATSLILVYGISILGSLVAETSAGILQVGNHFRSQAIINLMQSVVTAVMILIAAVTHAGVWFILWAYLLGKLILGILPVVVALRRLPEMLGKDWWRASFNLLPSKRELARFAISTNLSGTINMVARDSEVLWVGWFFSPVEVGYFKVALSLINLIVMPITPFISTSYPEITRAIVSQQWTRLRSLLRRVTLIAAGWTGAVAVGLLVLGKPLLFQPWKLFGHSFYIYKAEYLPAYGVLLVLLVGYGVANTFFWNRSLLLALDKPDFAFWAALGCMIAKVALAFVLVPRLGYLCEAWLLSGYFTLSVGLILMHGQRELKRRETAQQGAAA